MAKSKIRFDRLLKLADFLETVPRKSFDLRSWVQSKASRPEGDVPGECGFAGCAVGWAAHEKMFRGFVLQGRTPKYGDDLGFDAINVLFGIAPTQSEHLFYTGAYDNSRGTPKQVATRIRKFCEEA